MLPLALQGPAFTLPPRGGQRAPSALGRAAGQSHEDGTGPRPGGVCTRHHGEAHAVPWHWYRAGGRPGREETVLDHKAVEKTAEEKGLACLHRKEGFLTSRKSAPG